ncbi:hypothetical protein FE257_006680 [Aspergillus nanangensis]|uniref:Short chain dehydrogenase/reductase n=1 Tax=Aspergillus nanangensis TaxID=2582783 RepID=A0AAD4CNW8_ASPNN|nr:hypothetical protein FE257_006680 [Aspergillus nanangensis]
MSSSSTVVLITGANSGIGYATAEVLAAESPNYHVILASRSLSNGKAALQAIEAACIVKGSLSVIQLDVTDRASIEAAAKQIDQQFGRLDVLINNAGIVSRNSSLKIAIEETFAVNVIGVALVAEAFTPLLLRSPCPYSLFMSSGLGSLSMATDPNAGSYSAPYNVYRMSKAALNMFVVQQYKELNKKGVKVFAVCPGLVRSNLRGKDEESVSESGIAGDPKESGRTILSVIEGRRDGDLGRFVHAGGVYAW